MNKSPEDLQQYLKNQVCLCGSANFKCFEFENISIILKCNDCSVFNFINSNKFPQLTNFSDGTKIYFCEWGQKYPYFIYKHGDIKQINGINWFNKNKYAKKEVYQIPKKIAIKQYKFIIKQNQKIINKFRRNLHGLGV